MELSFTLDYSKQVKVLYTKVGISEAFPAGSAEVVQPDPEQLNAIWDTGATGSAITPEVVKALNLRPSGMCTISGVYGAKDTNTYLVNLFLPNKVVIPNIRVSEVDKLAGDFGVLIGMDIIGQGDFAVSNVDNKTVLTFRLPSKKRFDFVAESQKFASKQERRTSEKKAQKQMRKKIQARISRRGNR